MGNPVLASIRQIAYEVEETLRTKAPRLGHWLTGTAKATLPVT